MGSDGGGTFTKVQFLLFLSVLFLLPLPILILSSSNPVIFLLRSLDPAVSKHIPFCYIGIKNVLQDVLALPSLLMLVFYLYALRFNM